MQEYLDWANLTIIDVSSKDFSIIAQASKIEILSHFTKLFKLDNICSSMTIQWKTEYTILTPLVSKLKYRANTGK